VKVGYRQASYMQKPAQVILSGLFAFQRRPQQIFKSEKTKYDNLVIQQLYRKQKPLASVA
jgi:hypothetical protein